jgi:predicted enzyme related to lactoylglutathione lyase
MRNDLKGRFVWHELMTSDPDAAGKFYTDVVGWSTQPWEGGDGPYTMWMNGEMPVGGVMQLPEEAKAGGAPPHWLPYIGTPDVDATASRGKELGGKVMVQPMDIPEIGRFAVIADPQGAVFAAFASDNEPGGSEDPKVGEFSWHELITTDYEAAWDFYSELFGWEATEAMDMGEMGVYQMYGQGGTTYGGMFNKTAEMPQPPSWLCYARVRDVNQAAERIKAKGGSILNGPMEVPGGNMIVQGMDPQGAAFALHHTAS